jgi:hypothetical protein
MQKMNAEETKLKRYGKHPVIWGVFGGVTHRGFWVSWQQVAPMLAFIWIGSISSLAFGIRRVFKEMMLSETLKSETNTATKEEHRTIGWRSSSSRNQ